MSAGRQSVHMDDAAIAEFLASKIKVQVGTLDSSGGPHLTTLYYVMHDDKITFWTYKTSQKIVNLRRDPRIACLVEDGDAYFDLRGVSVRGRARIVDDVDEIRALGTEIVTRLAGGADIGEEGRAIVDVQATKRVAVIVEPEKVASWDHGKLNAFPGQGQGAEGKEQS